MVRKGSSRRRLKATFSACCIVAFVSLTFADAQSHDFHKPYELFSSEARAILESTEPRSCDEEWQLLWGLLKDGESAAGSNLAFAMLWGGLVPPGSGSDRVSLTRHLRILFSYAVPSDPDAVDFVAGDGGSFSDEFSYCLAFGWRTKQECLDRAIANGALPSIEAYDREITLLSDARKLPARCVDEAVLSTMAYAHRLSPDNAFIPSRPPCRELWCMPRLRGN